MAVTSGQNEVGGRALQHEVATPTGGYREKFGDSLVSTMSALGVSHMLCDGIDRQGHSLWRSPAGGGKIRGRFQAVEPVLEFERSERAPAEFKESCLAVLYQVKYVSWPRAQALLAAV